MELNLLDIMLLSSLIIVVSLFLLSLIINKKSNSATNNSLLELQNEKKEILQRLEEEKEKNSKQQIEKYSTLASFKSCQENMQNMQKEFSERFEEKNLAIEKANKKIEDMHSEIYSLKSLNSKYQAQLQAQVEGNKKLKDDLEEQGNKLELKINEIMQKTVESKLKKFDETSMKSLDGLLKPFKENLDSFKQKVEISQDNSTKKFAELSKEIEQITKMSIDIGNEARNLTQALKGKKQTQGRWGEMILESVLEFSGLLKGKHYETQESYRDDDGNIKRPDVIVKLPQARTIIIDSKVSLNDYDSYIKADNDKERSIKAKAVVEAFKNHINTLDSKDYTKYKLGTLQYIFMFVPIEGAFALAVQEDESLYEYALNKHIAIVTPSTLTVSLRTIYLFWQSEQSTSHATKMFSVAGKLYDKMVIFAQNFEKIGNQIQTVSNTYENAKTQLSAGNGNLMKRVEDLKTLGAKTTKSLKNGKITYSDFDDEEVDIEMVEEKI